MAHVFLKGYSNVFVSADGFVYRQFGQQKKKDKFPVTFNTDGVPRFSIDGKEYNLLYVMMEAFDIRYSPSDNLKYTVTKDGKIPLSSIHVSRFIPVESLSQEESDVFHSFRCDQKATAANSRAKDKITPIQVHFTLKLHDFRCRYCNKKLIHNKWQLDHYIPFSGNGKNRFDNIVPACKKCNVMKGTMMPQQFISLCRKVANHADFLNNNNGHDESINPNKLKTEAL
jgi:hypothetical protein